MDSIISALSTALVVAWVAYFIGHSRGEDKVYHEQNERDLNIMPKHLTARYGLDEVSDKQLNKWAEQATAAYRAQQGDDGEWKPTKEAIWLNVLMFEANQRDERRLWSDRREAARKAARNG